jgi:hypothetical protein
MSTSTGQIFMSTSSTTSYTNITGLTLTKSPAAPAAPNTDTFAILVTDLNGNPMAAGTTVGVTADSSVGTVTVSAGATSTIGCNSNGGPATSPFSSPAGKVGGNYETVTLTAPSNAGSGNITITVTSPQSKSTTMATIPVTINP